MPLEANGRPPFRADHIGSLLRPPPLRKAFRAHAAKEIADNAFRAAQDGGAAEALELRARGRQGGARPLR